MSSFFSDDQTYFSDDQIYFSDDQVYFSDDQIYFSDDQIYLKILSSEFTEEIEKLKKMKEFIKYLHFEAGIRTRDLSIRTPGRWQSATTNHYKFLWFLRIYIYKAESCLSVCLSVC